MARYHRTLSPQVAADRLAIVARDCEAARVPALSTVRDGFQPAYDRLRQRFGRLARWHAELNGIWSSTSDWAKSLDQTVRSAASITASLLREFESEPASVVPPTLVERVVDLYEQRLNHLESQWELLDGISSYAEELLDELIPLGRSGRRAGQALAGLARRILLDVRDVEHGAIDLPDAGVPVATAVASLAGRRGAETCVTAILSARLAAWVAPQFSLWAEAAESVTMAALLQDAGLTFWSLVQGVPTEELAARNPAAFRDHSRLSAALAGGISGIDFVIPEVVARHHERINGTGFPGRLTQWQLAPLARLLAVCTRFVELQHGVPAGREAALAASGGARCRERDSLDAGAQLLDEAERGAWDLTAARGLLQSLDLLPPERELDDASTTATPSLSALGARRLRRDSAHASLRGPLGRRAAMGAPRSEAAGNAPSRIPTPHFLRRLASGSPSRSPEVVPLSADHTVAHLVPGSSPH